MRVLVLEDDEDLGYLMRVAMESRGIECTVAQSLAEGRAKVKSARFDALLLDLLLPDGYGLALLDDLQESPSRGARVIVSSGNVSDCVRKDPRLADCLLKPYDLDRLFRALEQAG